MEELIARITSNVGIDAATAEKAVGMILAFLQKEGPADKVQQLLAAIPGAEEAVSQVKGGGFLSNLVGGVMGLGTQLMGAGLGMGKSPALPRKPSVLPRKRQAMSLWTPLSALFPALASSSDPGPTGQNKTRRSFRRVLFYALSFDTCTPTCPARPAPSH